MRSAIVCGSAAICRPFYVGAVGLGCSWWCFVATGLPVHDVTMTRSAAAAAAARADTTRRVRRAQVVWQQNR